jgi:hypothetical protein
LFGSASLGAAGKARLLHGDVVLDCGNCSGVLFLVHLFQEEASSLHVIAKKMPRTNVPGKFIREALTSRGEDAGPSEESYV